MYGRVIVALDIQAEPEGEWEGIKGTQGLEYDGKYVLVMFLLDDKGREGHKRNTEEVIFSRRLFVICLASFGGCLYKICWCTVSVSTPLT